MAIHGGGESGGGGGAGNEIIHRRVGTPAEWRKPQFPWTRFFFSPGVMRRWNIYGNMGRKFRARLLHTYFTRFYSCRPVSFFVPLLAVRPLLSLPSALSVKEGEARGERERERERERFGLDLVGSCTRLMPAGYDCAAITWSSDTASGRCRREK